MRHWGSNVGAHFTASTSRRWWASKRASSIWAESSFLPPWRAISTEKLRPRRASTLRSTARAMRCWYGRSAGMEAAGGGAGGMRLPVHEAQHELGEHGARDQEEQAVEAVLDL